MNIFFVILSVIAQAQDGAAYGPIDDKGQRLTPEQLREAQATTNRVYDSLVLDAAKKSIQRINSGLHDNIFGDNAEVLHKKLKTQLKGLDAKYHKLIAIQNHDKKEVDKLWRKIRKISELSETASFLSQFKNTDELVAQRKKDEAVIRETIAQAPRSKESKTLRSLLPQRIRGFTTCSRKLLG